VPANLAVNYRGSAGNGTTSPAGVSIQFEYDLKTGKILDLTLTPAVRNDQTDASQTREQVCPKDLIIRDLGYFSIAVLESIAQQKAYFLSRLSSNVEVYDQDGQALDFHEIYRTMTSMGISLCHKPVFIGKQRFALSLVIGLVPNHVYEERIRKKLKQAHKKGHSIKARTRLLCHFNLFITNATRQQLPPEKVLPLYRCRWQVELMFKNWKSIFSIHKQQKMKEERYITMLYIRLILIVVNLQLVNHLQQLLARQGFNDKIVSYYKTLKTLKNMFGELLKILRCAKDKAVKITREIYQTLTENHWRDKRINKWNFLDFVGLFI
jgi:transposase